MSLHLVSDWMKNNAGRLMFGREFSFGMAIFGITLVGLYFFGKLRVAGFMLLGLGFEMSWDKGIYDGRET